LDAIVVFASAIVFVPAFMFRFAPDRIIIASVLAAGTVFSGFLIRPLGKDKDTSNKSGSV
jgi:hypothetical protein